MTVDLEALVAVGGVMLSTVVTVVTATRWLRTQIREAIEPLEDRMSRHEAMMLELLRASLRGRCQALDEEAESLVQIRRGNGG